MNEWQVWDLGRDPVLTGTEQECKDYVEARSESNTLYVQDPNGLEYEFDGRKWREC